MLKQKGFFDSHYNNESLGFKNDFELQSDGEVVYDHASGLVWQQSGSDKDMKYEDAKEYIERLNHKQFVGYSDWRLPTLEEAMSLMEPTKKNGDLYIDPKFDKQQRWIWTSDLCGVSIAWVVYFDDGDCDFKSYSLEYSVRAVR